MEWKRWRHCWQLFKDGKKIGVVTCKGWDNGASQFFTFLKGKRITPHEHERFYMTEEGGWSSLWRAKRVLEMEAEVL